MSNSFKENDLRPNDLNVESKKAMKEDIKRLVEQKGEFVEVDCPACTSNSYKFAFQKEPDIISIQPLIRKNRIVLLLGDSRGQTVFYLTRTIRPVSQADSTRKIETYTLNSPAKV